MLDKIIKNKDIILNLSNFFGGHIEVTSGIGRAIKKNCLSETCSITTIILEGVCASSCVGLFMVGKKRIAHEYTQFAFHGSAAPFGINLPAFHSINYYVKSGISKAWLLEKKHMFDDKNVIWSFFPFQMSGSNVVTEIIRE